MVRRNRAGLAVATESADRQPDVDARADLGETAAHSGGARAGGVAVRPGKREQADVPVPGGARVRGGRPLGGVPHVSSATAEGADRHLDRAAGDAGGGRGYAGEADADDRALRAELLL